METILDTNISDNKDQLVVYGTFWKRLGALFIDGLILLPVTGLAIYNLISWKSPSILAITSLISIAYKPFLEYRYGATIGKMALNLIVVNTAYQKVNLTEALTRNIFSIVLGIFSILTTFLLLNAPGFEDATTLTAYSEFSRKSTLNTGFSIFAFAVYLLDCIFLWSDDRKRSLHDRIANTYVIEKQK
ncbi:MAG TPA: RDD family protein [Chitinophagales bacterium]|nr:RDD family protein [Chitinophagales bacterium]